VRVWDTRTGQQVERLRGHKDSVYSVAFSPAGDSLVSGSLDKSLKVWDLRQTKLAAERAQPGHPSPTGLGVLQQTLVGHKVSYISSHHRVALILRRTTCCRSVLLPMAHGSCPGPRTAVYNSGSRTDRRSSCCRDTRIQASLISILVLPALTPSPVISIDLAKSGSLFASGSGDCHARIWQYTNV
jgi:glucose repression regulatory protein TUP1